MSNYDLPPPATPSEPTVPQWTPPLPTTYPPPTSYFSSTFDDSSSSSSTSTFGIIIGVLVGVFGLILLYGIWHKYLKKRCSK
ncbi:hypothetical protein GLYMA_09G119900v4 [Glycine max]|uniref:Uncharacterized protein n=2 Tax=Glycine subgen. Soja TaxID=1462606 RepID=K7LDE1_SOYBN|nr:RING-H2 finger protein ATL51 [Glycine max]KHN03148.1 hypothetical protein glysoja_038917 [Glycine soja]KAH1042654.1 hypothetical protein GYH30_024789 [Glycine max]KAH1233215.1 hypothetical protein GmHk_09G025710 [Glycine max]KRH38228.1 hypothetical protein GLYMA_09G119900v4 [Glycine max]RZB91724.1 hypothetical protein D0Y65_023918 [Glycine soja]|eukprot:XP_025979406.1 RING-H2 finger protein ATL51-like [Glycine max]